MTQRTVWDSLTVGQADGGAHLPQPGPATPSRASPVSAGSASDLAGYKKFSNDYARINSLTSNSHFGSYNSLIVSSN